MLCVPLLCWPCPPGCNRSSRPAHPSHLAQELKLQYGQAKGKAYTEEEDRFLVRGWERSRGKGEAGRGISVSLRVA